VAIELDCQASEQQESQSRNAAAEGCALEADQQETLLELGSDETGLGADEMQHLDNVPVACHRAPGGEDDRQHGGCEHERQDADADQTR
jgi:hypothetical protein